MRCMNTRGHRETLVPAHPGNLNAVKSGAHSSRLIEERAMEILDDFGIAEELDETGQVALQELARLSAVIEAIDRDLSARGVTDRNGKERYLLQRRERFSRRVLEVSDRVHEARNRSRRQRATASHPEITAEQGDYVRSLQEIALGYDPEASVSDRLAALRLLTNLREKGTSSHYQPKPESNDVPFPDDKEFQAKVERLKEEKVAARKEGYLNRLRREIKVARVL
jgi:hypothetical protein